MSMLPECPTCFGLLVVMPSGRGLSSRCRCDDTPAETKAEAEYLASLRNGALGLTETRPDPLRRVA